MTKLQRARHHPLRRWRFEYDCTLERLAAAADTTASYICEIELGDKHVRRDLAERLSRATAELCGSLTDAVSAIEILFWNKERRARR